jgi:hypothetical protein
MADEMDALLVELKAVIAELSQVTDTDGVPAEQRKHVLAVLGEYVACLEHDPPTATDCNRVARIVVAYWPLNLAAGEHVVSVEQKLRSFFRQRR